MAPKRGRPKRGEEENRAKQVNVRLTETELKELNLEAKIAGLSVGDYVRRRVMGRPVAAHVDRAMINELRRQGALLKKIHLDSKGAYRTETRDTILAIQAAITRVGISDQ